MNDSGAPQALPTTAACATAFGGRIRCHNTNRCVKQPSDPARIAGVSVYLKDVKGGTARAIQQAFRQSSGNQRHNREFYPDDCCDLNFKKGSNIKLIFVYINSTI
jgi:hypothetical protein